MTVERRGRGSTGRPKKLPKDVEKDLLAEVQRLRAENDYLKNLQKMFYYRGLSEWGTEKGYLTDTCLDGQDTFKKLMAMFDIES